VLFFAGNSDADIALYHAVSTDGGASFQPETKVSGLHFPGLIDDVPGPTIDGLAEDRLYPCPHLRAGKSPGLLYATWSADGVEGQVSEGFDVWFARSTDNGATWTDAKTVNAGPNALAEQFYPALDVNDNGVIALSYYDRSANPGGTATDYAVAYSFDEGETFTAMIAATAMPSDFASIGDLNGGFGIGEYTQVVSTPYFAIPVWADGRTNDGDIDLYAAFLPIGATLSPATEVGAVSTRFSVYVPNPSPVALDLRVDLLDPSRLTIQVFTADGRLAYAERGDQILPAGAHRRTIQTPEPGVYVCRVDTDFGFRVRKVVVR
jgi:hypothetical protein